MSITLRADPDTRKVHVTDVNIEANEAHIIDEYGATLIFRTDIRPWKAKGPLPGEDWIAARMNGEWIFVAQFNSTDEDIDTSRIRGYPVKDIQPQLGQVLAWNHLTDQWEPVTWAPDNLPWGFIDQAKSTVNQGAAASGADIVGTSITWTAVVGRRLRYRVFIPLKPSAADDWDTIILLDGVAIGSGGEFVATAANQRWTATGEAIFAPAPGPHTIKAQLLRVAGAGTMTVEGTSAKAIFATLEDIGQTADPLGTITDAIGITDSIEQSAGSAPIVIVNAVGITDAMGATLTTAGSSAWTRTRSDSIGITDSVSVVYRINHAAVLDERIGVTDAPGGWPGIYSALGRTAATDAIGVTDTRAVAPGRIFSDSIGITDFAYGSSRVLTDSVGITDSHSRVSPSNRTLTDNEGITDVSRTFLPTDITNLAAWYDASDAASITASVGKVSQWNDKSGSGYHLVQATEGSKPTTGTRTQNGMNVLDFDGSADYMWYTHGSTIMSGANSIFVVFKSDTPSGNQQLYDLRRSSSNYPLHDDAGQGGFVGRVRHDSGLYTANTSGPARNTNTHIHACIYSRSGDGVKRFWMDGTGYTNASSVSTPTTIDRISLAANGSTPASYFDGHIAEFLLYTVALTDAQRVDVESYLRMKWATP